MPPKFTKQSPLMPPSATSSHETPRPHCARALIGHFCRWGSDGLMATGGKWFAMPWGFGTVAASWRI
ncbi:immunoglobulin heavy chain variable region [Sesbania bispinosa]|nr:immunoglobulin heavy chain variable region [Sesbania bispinosa]